MVELDLADHTVVPVGPAEDVTEAFVCLLTRLH
jgi:hypothetical protein